MKFAIALLLAASLLQAQTIKPTSLTMTTVPGDFSSSQDVAFINPGSVPITVMVSTTGPFILLKNECGNGVRPDSHCNVYLTYGATAVGEMDRGTLVFRFNQQAITMPLTGYTVNMVGTNMTTTKGKTGVIVTIDAAGNIIPASEEVTLSCMDEEGVNTIWEQSPLKNNKASLSTPGGSGEGWACQANYNGDAEFAPSEVNFCVGNWNYFGYRGSCPY